MVRKGIKTPEKTIKLIQSLYKKSKGKPSFKEIAKKAKVSPLTVYIYTKAKEDGYESTSDWKKDKLAKSKKRNFASYYEYQKYLAREHQKRPRNKALSRVIKTGLKEIGKSPYWLAKQVGVSRQMVSFYVQAKSFPTSDILKKIYSTLEIENHQTLDSLLEKSGL